MAERDDVKPSEPGSGGTRLLSPPFLLEAVAGTMTIGIGLFLLLGPVVVLPWHLFRHLVSFFTLVMLLSIGLIGVFEIVRWRWWPTAARIGPQPGELRSGAFWVDSGRIITGLALVETAYLLLKVFVPVIRPGNFDAWLGALDRALLWGRPAISYFAGLASHPHLLQMLDICYSRIYFFLLWGSTVAFFALLPRRWRLAFFGSFALLWQVGLVLYIAVPSWGPVFVHPAGFERILAHMPATVQIQQELVRETTAIVRHHFNLSIRFYGLAAFPSLHIGVMFFFFLWSRHVSKWWTVWNGVWVIVMVFGSIITGYHYLIDAFGGVAIALGAYGAGLVLARGKAEREENARRRTAV